MPSKFPSFLLFLLFFFILTEHAFCQDGEAGEEEGEEGGVQKTCPQYLVDLALNVVPKTITCLFGKNKANLRFASFYEYLSRFWCIIKCVMVEMEILGLDGRLDELNAIVVGQDMLPQWAFPRFAEKTTGCLQLAENFKPSQYFCQSYIPFFQCAMARGTEPGASFMADCIGPPILSGFLGIMRIFVPPTNEGGGGEEGSDDRRRRRLKSPLRNRTTIQIPLLNRFVAMLFSDQMQYELANMRAKGKNNFTRSKKPKKQQKLNKTQQIGNNVTAIGTIVPSSTTTEKYSTVTTWNKNGNRLPLFLIAGNNNNNNPVGNTQNIFSVGQSLINSFWNVQKQFTGGNKPIGSSYSSPGSVDPNYAYSGPARANNYYSNPNTNKYPLQIYS